MIAMKAPMIHKNLGGSGDAQDVTPEIDGGPTNQRVSRCPREQDDGQ